DGDFPREVLGSRNLTFAAYRMPTRRNKAAIYDAKLKGPSGRKLGVLKLGTLEFPDDEEVADADSFWSPRMTLGLPATALFGLLSGLTVVMRSRRKRHGLLND
ncbi:MAG: hypothetical protein N2C14_20275, partial [Planctomycetales bacterium]